MGSTLRPRPQAPKVGPALPVHASPSVRSSNFKAALETHLQKDTGDHTLRMMNYIADASSQAVPPVTDESTFPISRDEDWLGLNQEIRRYCPHNVRTGNSCLALDMCRSKRVCTNVQNPKRIDPYTMKQCQLAHFVPTCSCLENGTENTCKRRLGTTWEKKSHEYPGERKQLLAEPPNKIPRTVNQGWTNTNLAA